MADTNAKAAGSAAGWSRTAKGFHWLIAGLILLAIAVAYLAGQWGELGGTRKQQYWLYMLHKSLGLSVLALAGARLIWRLSYRRPPALISHSPFERKAAEWAHVALYALLFLLPISGWWLNSVAGIPLRFFLLFPVPALSAADPALENLATWIHNALGLALMVILLAHVAGALKHHWRDNDATLNRMLPAGRLRRVTLLGMAALLAGAVAAGALAEYAQLTKSTGSAVAERQPDSGGDATTEPAVTQPQGASEQSDNTPLGWQVMADSELTFSVEVMGSTINGRFKQFSANVNFDPQNLSTSRISAVINTPSIFTNNSTRDAMLPEADWFAIAEYSTAEFRTINIQPVSDSANTYRADATLRIRDVTQPVAFQFSWRQSGNSATLIGESTLNRLDYKLGASDFADSDTIGYAVPVRVELRLSR